MYIKKMFILETDENDFKFSMCHFVCMGNLFKLFKTQIFFLPKVQR